MTQNLTEQKPIQMFNMDAKDLLRAYPNKHFDLGIIDPPYGIGEDGSKNHTRSVIAKSKDYKGYTGGDMEAPDSEYFDLLNQKCKNWIIWGANHFIDNLPFNVSSPCWIVWDKDNGQNDFADCELALTNMKSAVRLFKYRWHGMLQQNMKDKEVRIHPNQKPVALYTWLLQKYAKEGYKIVDTHSGSASIAIAVDSLNKIEKMNLTLVAGDKDPHYFQKSQIRVKVKTSWQSIF